MDHFYSCTSTQFRTVLEWIVSVSASSNLLVTPPLNPLEGILFISAPAQEFFFTPPRIVIGTKLPDTLGLCLCGWIWFSCYRVTGREMEKIGDTVWHFSGVWGYFVAG